MENQEVLRNISWMINQLPSEAQIYINEDYDNPITLSDEIKNQIVFNENIIIEVPTHRFSESFQRISVKRPCNVENILNTIYSFYMENIPEHALDNTPDDVWNYVSKAKSKINNGESVKWIDIMGDLIFFEGLYKLDSTSEQSNDNVYGLILGS
jgi:hypothetical protein